MRRGRALRPRYHMRQAEVCFKLAEAPGDKMLRIAIPDGISFPPKAPARRGGAVRSESPELISSQAPQSPERRKSI